MINLSKEVIKDIAEHLDCGMKCYCHKKTQEIIKTIDFESNPGSDEELWEDVLTELEENWGDYLEFERMDSRDSFRVMADYAELVDDSALREKLIDALNRPKPFGNFKWIVDNSGDYRQKWFEFKNQEYIEWVEARIRSLNIVEEFDDEKNTK